MSIFVEQEIIDLLQKVHDINQRRKKTQFAPNGRSIIKHASDHSRGRLVCRSQFSEELSNQ